jgi:hypothetical protein
MLATSIKKYKIMIPNPKKEVQVDYPIGDVKSAFQKFPQVNGKYTLESYNEIMKMFQFSSFEFMSLGVFVDVSLNQISETKTKIDIEVKRKVGAFDEWYEVQQANTHIDTILKDVSEIILNPNIEVSTTSQKSQTNKNLAWKVLGWVIGLIVLLAAPGSKMPAANILIFHSPFSFTFLSLFSVVPLSPHATACCHR